LNAVVGAVVGAAVGAGAAAGVALPASSPSFATTQWHLEHDTSLELKLLWVISEVKVYLTVRPSFGFNKI